MRTLVAAATGAGHIAIRVVTGCVLLVFLLAYAAAGALLLPFVGAAFGAATLARRTRLLGQRLSLGG